MKQVQTPIKGFTGAVVGVQFINGQGTTDDPRALAYFARQGYTVTDVVPDVPDFEDMTKRELVDYAATLGINASPRAKKSELLKMVRFQV